MGCSNSNDKPVVDKNPKKEIPEYKIILIGDSSVGKTAMIHQYISGTFANNKLQPTTGVQNQYKMVDVPGGGKDGRPLKMKLDIWDTAGTESAQAIARNFYTGSHAVIVVYSVISQNSFKSVDQHMNNINQYCNDENVLKFLVGNKCDL